MTERKRESVQMYVTHGLLFGRDFGIDFVLFFYERLISSLADHTSPPEHHLSTFEEEAAAPITPIMHYSTT